MLDTSNTVTNKLYVAVTLHIIFQFPNNFGSAGSGSATILQISSDKKIKHGFVISCPLQRLIPDKCRLIYWLALMVPVLEPVTV